MNRRQFLAAAAAAAAATPVAMARPTRPPPLGEDICRATPAAERPAAPPSGPLSYAGTRLLKDGFLWDLAAAYERETGHRIRILGGGCDDGVVSVRAGKVDLGGLCCHPAAGTPTVGLDFLPVADDLVVPLAHASNPVDGVTFEQVRAVMNGGITDWSELGGPRRPIAVIVFDHCPDYLEPLRHTLFGGAPRWAKRALFVKTDQHLLEQVARFEAGFTVYNMVLAQPLIQAGRLKALSLDGVEPFADGRPSPEYALRGRFGLAFRHWRENVMRPFFDYLYGPSGQAILARRLLPVTADEAGYPSRLRQG